MAATRASAKNLHAEKPYDRPNAPPTTTVVTEAERADALVQLAQILEAEKREAANGGGAALMFANKECVYQKYDWKLGKTTARVGMFNGQPKLRLSNDNENEIIQGVTVTKFTNDIGDVVEGRTIYLNNTQVQSLAKQFSKIILCHKNGIYQSVRLGDHGSEVDKGNYEMFGVDCRPMLVVEPGKETVIITYTLSQGIGNQADQSALPDVMVILNTFDLNELATVMTNSVAPHLKKLTATCDAVLVPMLELVGTTISQIMGTTRGVFTKKDQDERPRRFMQGYLTAHMDASNMGIKSVIISRLCQIIKEKKLRSGDINLFSLLDQVINMHEIIISKYMHY